MHCVPLPSPLLPFTACVRSLSAMLRWAGVVLGGLRLLCCLLCSACFAVCCYCMTAGWGATEVHWMLRPGALCLVM